MNISKLHLSWKTIFSHRDIELILQIKKQSVRDFLDNQRKNWVMKSEYRGLWSIIWKDIDHYELWYKLKKKSYISFETALQYHWIIFQDYSSIISLASDDTREKQIDNHIYTFKKIKDEILLNPIGVSHQWEYSFASKERAICDILYLKSWFTFDNIRWVDLQKLEEISQIYNKRTKLEIKKIIKDAQNSNT